MRIGRLTVLAVLGSVAALMVGASGASADYGNLAQYQITFSQNCNNAALCLGGGQGLGGDWGWGVLNSDGTGDLQIAFCGHAPGLGGGAGHEAVDISSWSIDETNGVFFIGSASDPSFEGDTPFPSTPGHYNIHSGPGVTTEVTVVKIPNR
jgi:hypothetical protein